MLVEPPGTQLDAFGSLHVDSELSLEDLFRLSGFGSLHVDSEPEIEIPLNESLRKLTLGSMIIDGVQTDCIELPQLFYPDKTDDSTPMSTSYPTHDGRRVVVNQKHQLNGYSDRRSMYANQSWRAVWESSESYLSKDLYEHFIALKSLAKKFWIQFDDEMSRDLAMLHPVNTDYRAYYTPTYPIAPFGYTPSTPYGYEGTVYVNGTAQNSGFIVDSMTGTVIFDTALTESDIVTMSYTWKAFVRIAQMDLRLVPPESQFRYMGNIVFQQEESNYSSEYNIWRTRTEIDPPYEYSMPSGWSVPSVPSTPSIPSFCSDTYVWNGTAIECCPTANRIWNNEGVFQCGNG